MSYRQFFGYLALTLAAIVAAAAFGYVVRILTLPTPEPTEPKTDAPYYLVRRGDTLSEISQKTGIALDQLTRLNREVDPLALEPGRRIRLRASAPPTDARRNRRTRRGPVPRHYVIRQGDTLTGISEKTGVPPYRIFKLNPAIAPKTLLPGQRIRLRGSAERGKSSARGAGAG